MLAILRIIYREFCKARLAEMLLIGVGSRRQSAR
jgi:hypothetical protein